MNRPLGVTPVLTPTRRACEKPGCLHHPRGPTSCTRATCPAPSAPPAGGHGLLLVGLNVAPTASGLSRTCFADAWTGPLSLPSLVGAPRGTRGCPSERSAASPSPCGAPRSRAGPAALLPARRGLFFLDLHEPLQRGCLSSGQSDPRPPSGHCCSVLHRSGGAGLGANARTGGRGLLAPPQEQSLRTATHTPKHILRRRAPRPLARPLRGHLILFFFF